MVKTYVIDVSDNAHVSDVVLLVHHLTELLYGKVHHCKFLKRFFFLKKSVRVF